MFFEHLIKIEYTIKDLSYSQLHHYVTSVIILVLRAHVGASLPPPPPLGKVEVGVLILKKIPKLSAWGGEYSADRRWKGGGGDCAGVDSECVDV
jgi:hypothetical protein